MIRIIGKSDDLEFNTGSVIQITPLLGSNNEGFCLRSLLNLILMKHNIFVLHMVYGSVNQTIIESEKKTAIRGSDNTLLPQLDAPLEKAHRPK